MLHLIPNKTSPIKNRLDLLQFYVPPILSNAELPWASFITSSQERRVESVQTIGIRTITGMPWFVNFGWFVNLSNLTYTVAYFHGG